MKKKLKNIRENNLFHYRYGQRVKGPNPNLHGNCVSLAGNCSSLWGDCSGLVGDCTNIVGGCTGITGDLDCCELIKEDRKRGIDIEDLIKEREHE